MKKRNIIIISLSTISLVFAGLVYLAVTTFPELIEEVKIESEEEYVEEIFTDAPVQAELLPEINEEPAETFAFFEENYFEFDEEISYTPVENVVVEVNEPTIIEVEEIKVEPIIEEVVVEECQLDLDSVISSEPLSEEYFDEEPCLISDIDDDFVMTITPTYIEAVEVMDEEEPLLIKEEKREVLDMVEVNNDTAIMNTTIIAIGISEVLAYILIKRKRRHHFR